MEGRQPAHQQWSTIPDGHELRAQFPCIPPVEMLLAVGNAEGLAPWPVPLPRSPTILHDLVCDCIWHERILRPYRMRAQLVGARNVIV
jgi:hypothetical protein